MAIDKLSDVLKQEAEGIMFPFRNKVKPVSNTTQEAYNSTTDGIMSITGKQYIGPDSVIQYGDSYQRQLKQIEKGMLPQFDQQQFPDVGEGKVEDRGFPKAQPVDTTPVQPDEPKFDPCPPGFKFDPKLQRCVPIEQPKSDKDEPIKIDPRKNIGDIAEGLDIATKALQKANISSSTKGDVSVDIDNGIFWLNFIPVIGKPLNAYQKKLADEKLKKLAQADGITVTTNPDGTQKLNISDAVGKRSYGQLQTKESLSGNMASTQKLNAAGTAIEKAPNGQNMIVGPITLDYFGKGNLFQPTTRTPAETDALNAEEKNKLLSELDAALGLDSTATAPKSVTVDPESTAADAKGGAEVPIAFGQLKDLNEFGQLIRDNEVAKLNIENSNVEMDMMETLYRTGKVEFNERNAKFIDEQNKQEEERERIEKNNKKIDEKIEELGMSDSQAQEQGFKDSREQFEFRVKASQEANQRAEGKRTSQSQFTGGKSHKGGATATGTTRCFHPDTDINGKKIKDIKAGDYINDSLVEGMVQFKMNNPYYLIDGIKVSGSHGVLHDDKWIFVADHPESKEVEDVTEFVYVPIVEGGTFKINNTTYADYDYHDIVVLGDDEWKKRRGFK